jgi:hypothetical protein
MMFVIGMMMQAVHLACAQTASAMCWAGMLYGVAAPKAKEPKR